MRFAVLYRWRVKPELEATHREGWRRVTEAIRRAHATGGSRLHRAADGSFYAYAVWPDEETFERARVSASPASDEDRALMRDGLEGGVEIVARLEILDDMLTR